MSGIDSDLFMVLGVIIGGLAIPSLIGAFSESRSPRAAAIMIVLAGGLMTTAFATRPSGYTLQDIPNAFVRVVGKYLN